MNIVLSGRTGIETAENAVFPCLVTLPVRVRLSGTNLDTVQRYQEYSTKVLPYQHTPLRQIQKACGHVDSALFDSIVVFQNNAAGLALFKDISGKAFVHVGFESRCSKVSY